MVGVGDGFGAGVEELVAAGAVDVGEGSGEIVGLGEGKYQKVK